MEVMDVVLVETFELLVAQMLSEILEALDVKQRQQPLIECQLVDEWNLGPATGPAAGRRGDLASAAGAATRHHMAPASNISRWKSSSMRRTFHVSSGALRFSRLLPPLT